MAVGYTGHDAWEKYVDKQQATLRKDQETREKDAGTLDTTKLKEVINTNVSDTETRETKDAANRLLSMKDSTQTNLDVPPKKNGGKRSKSRKSKKARKSKKSNNSKKARKSKK